MEMMDLNIVIDEMSVDDLLVISDIEQRSYDFPWSKNIFNDCLLSGYKCIVARKNEVIMGYAVLTLSSNEAQILNLCVDQKYRNLGYGEKILDFLINEVRNLKIIEIYLEVRPSNKKAIALYLKKGFEKIGERPSYYKHSDGREDAEIFLLNTKKIGYFDEDQYWS